MAMLEVLTTQVVNRKFMWLLLACSIYIVMRLNIFPFSRVPVLTRMPTATAGSYVAFLRGANFMGGRALGLGAWTRTMRRRYHMWTIRDQHIAVDHSDDFVLPGYDQERKGNLENHCCA